MRYSIFILFSFFLISLTSCRTDFDTIPSSGKLEFSDETVYLDTIFSQISSSTYQLKVYNRSNDDIKIPTIRLEKPDSNYRLMVDGRSDNNGKRFDNVELLAKDSLFIFIETTVVNATSQLEFTYEDKILFDEGTNQQSVDLITLVQDCHFIRPNRNLDASIYETITIEGFDPQTQGHTLTTAEELNWTKTKPYVIYGNAVVPAGSTLNIAAGARVYFHDGATLIVDNGATLNIDGDLNIFDPLTGKVAIQNEVTFEGDRLEPVYENVPGQWGAIILLSGNNNKIDHLTLKNAVVGIFAQRNVSTTTPKLEITNSQIYDCSNVGILARSSIINAENLVMNNAGQACFAGTIGGNYDFLHCTFNNDWPSTTQVAVNLSNYIEVEGVLKSQATLNANFKNCIIYGKNNIELFLDKKYDSGFVTNFENCLVKFKDENTALVGNAIYNQIRNINTSGNKINVDPKFKKSDRNLMWPTENLNFIVTPAATSNLIDILGKPRTNIGAYQFIPNL
jgi:hypothetical protein